MILIIITVLSLFSTLYILVSLIFGASNERGEYKEVMERYQVLEEKILKEEDFEVRQQLKDYRVEFSDEVLDKMLKFKDSGLVGGKLFFGGGHISWTKNHIKDLKHKEVENLLNEEMVMEIKEEIKHFEDYLEKIKDIDISNDIAILISYVLLSVSFLTFYAASQILIRMRD